MANKINAMLYYTIFFKRMIIIMTVSTGILLKIKISYTFKNNLWKNEFLMLGCNFLSLSSRTQIARRGAVILALPIGHVTDEHVINVLKTVMTS